ncbi:MAG: LPS export ABC transporter periplasmic protein LptC [Campylobacterota bacterium]|nr:LPS export ABC transporter periplasmic protein LptC [Campylobacterota bacterium]
MGITKFIYLLLFFAALFLFYSKENIVKVIEKVEKPLVEFENSVMYDISKDGLSQVIQSQNAYKFTNSEQLKNATILIKSKKDNNKSTTISAEQIVKVSDDLYLNKNVIFETENKITLKTEELQYNLKDLIAKNNSFFKITENNNSFEGERLYFNGKINHIKASKTHFKIDLKENNETD